MVADNIKNIQFYKGLGTNIVEGLNYLLNTDLLNVSEGKHVIKGDEIFASVNSYQTKEYDETRWEAHKKYIDIQFVAMGSEKIYFAPVGNMKEEIISYNADKDIMFLKGDGNFITLFPGQFVIFFPTDAHQPCVSNKSVESVKKIVIKVKV